MYGGGVISGPMDPTCMGVGLYQVPRILRVWGWGYIRSHGSPVHFSGVISVTMDLMCTVVGLYRVP